VVRRALERGLAVIAITDHDTIDGAIAAAALDAGCEVVIGEEVTSADGHVLALFLTEAVPPGLDAASTIERIHEQGGLAIPAHPYLRLGGARGVGDAGVGLPWDAIESVNGSPGAWLANRQARRMHRQWAKAQTGGSDAHILDAVGVVVTLFEGRSADDLRRAIERGTTRAIRARHSPLPGAMTFTRSLWRRVTGEAARERLRRGLPPLYRT
jgi:predicted metal-dependent phosphoesterase TrpH